MANKNGLTIKAGFEKALAMYKDLGDAEMVAFFEKRLEQNAKKSSNSGERKLTPHQLENEKIKEGILDSMVVGTVYSIADMLNTFNCFPEGMTPNRLSALLSQLGPKGSQQIERIEQKGKVYFTLPTSDEYAE